MFILFVLIIIFILIVASLLLEGQLRLEHKLERNFKEENKDARYIKSRQTKHRTRFQKLKSDLTKVKRILTEDLEF